MATRELLTPSQRLQFYEVPENMDQRELARYYTITPEEKSVIHQQRGAPNRLGYAVQICYLRFPGRPMAADESVPESILHYIAKQIGISPDALKHYASSRGGEQDESIYGKLEISLDIEPSLLKNI